MNRALDRARRSSSQVWLDVVSAVDYLSRGHRTGLTVYDALEEALRWHIDALVSGYDELPAVDERVDLPWDDPDPLRTALDQLALHNPPSDDGQSTSAHAIHGALAHWVGHMADQYNDGCMWARPTSAI
ncbi:MAG: hypothetical protein IPL07_20700 [Acidimicrobiaceae bacterium]|nr:hypothetical protein [Acidimicrobiaceae bacterium]